MIIIVISVTHNITLQIGTQYPTDIIIITYIYGSDKYHIIFVGIDLNS